eukprot:8672456-Karenia_brevis.AAC.1
MALPFLEGAALESKFQECRGRAVFFGDNVRDQHDYLAVLSEQGTSACHMAASKFLLAIGRMA